VDEAECHTAVRHFYLEAEAEVVLTEFVVAFFSFAVAVAVAVAVAKVHAVAVAKVHAVAFAGSPLLLVVVVVVVVDWKAVVHLFEEFDLLAAGIQTWFQQLRLTDLTFVVLRRTMLHYYSFQFK
jgi:hypothetical protein